MRTKLRSKISLLFVAFAVMLAVPAVALAAELVTNAEVDNAAVTSVTVTQGESTNFNIKVAASGNVAAGSTHWAKVMTRYDVSGAGVVQASNLSNQLDFQASSGTGQVPITGGPYTVNASIHAASDAQPGTYEDAIVLSEAAGTTQTSSDNSTGGKLDDVTATAIDVVVEEAPQQDTTGPSITITTPANGGTYLVNQVVNANYQCSDPSGVASCVGPVLNGAAIDTSSVSSKSFKVDAEDSLGNKSSLTHNYNVRAYDFIGFSSPVDNPTVLNNAKAGQAIPLKWRLMDNGTPVTNLQSVKVTVQSLSCTQGTTSDNIEEYAAGSSGLQNLGDGYYQFNWKSPTTYANSCKTLAVNGLGVQSQALFKFTK